MLEKTISLVSRIGLIFGSVLLAIMMVLTVIDVFMRYVFASPLPSVAELTQIMLSMVVFVGFILVSRDGTHIVVSLFEPFFMRVAPRFYRLLYAVSNTLGTVFILWVLILTAKDAYIFRDHTEALEIPLTWLLAVLILSCVFATLGSFLVFSKGQQGHGSAE